jgi:hypothetical protein
MVVFADKLTVYAWTGLIVQVVAHALFFCMHVALVVGVWLDF